MVGYGWMLVRGGELLRVADWMGGMGGEGRGMAFWEIGDRIYELKERKAQELR